MPPHLSDAWPGVDERDGGRVASPPAPVAQHDSTQQQLLHTLPPMSELQLLQHILSAWHGLPTPLFEPQHSRHPGASSSSHVRYVSLRALSHLSAGAASGAVADLTAMCNLRADLSAFIRAFGAHDARTGRCLQSFCACLSSILDRYDLMLLPFEQELSRQRHALAVGESFDPTLTAQEEQEEELQRKGTTASHEEAPPPRRNVPLTLLSLQSYVAPFIPQLVLLGDLVHRAAPSLYEDPAGIDGAALPAASAVVAPSSASLLSLLYSALELHSVLRSSIHSSLCFCLFLSGWLPYLEYMDALTSRGVVLPGAEEDGFFVRRVERAPVPPKVEQQTQLGQRDGDDDDEELDTEDAYMRSQAPPAAPVDKSCELVLRLGVDGNPDAPSFLQPYAHHILLTARSRAMVRSIQRAHHPAAGSRGHAVASNLSSSRARLRKQQSQAQSAAAASAASQLPAIAATEGPNLFRSFHEGLAELFGLQLPGVAATGVTAAAAAAQSNASAVSAQAHSTGSSAPVPARRPRSARASPASSLQSPSSDFSDSEYDEDAASSPASASSSLLSSQAPSPASSVRSSPARAHGGSRSLIRSVGAGSAEDAASLSLAAASSPVSAVASEASPPLSTAERDQLAIFFATDFDSVHPLFKPPEEPGVAASAPEGTPPSAPTGAAPAPASGSGANNATPAPSHFSSWPRLKPSFAPSLAASSFASFVTPALMRNAWTEAAASEPARLGQKEAHVYATTTLSAEEQEAADAARAEEARALERLRAQGTAETGPATLTASAFLASVPISSSLSSLQSLSDLLLFHAHFPPHALQEFLPRCILAPLSARFDAATQAFVQTVLHTCGLKDHLLAMREFFLMSDGFLGSELCRGLFDKLDAGEADIIGLNHVFTDALSRHGSATLRRTVAASLRLELIPLPTPPSQAHNRSSHSTLGPDTPVAPSPATPRELVAPLNPQSLSAIDQLEVRCTIPWPLSAILTPESLRSYNAIWRLLVQVRRAEAALNDCALPNASAAPHSVANHRAHAAAVASGRARLSTAGNPLTRSVRFHGNISSVQHAFYLLKAELVHFLRTMLSYLLGQATETFWGQFQAHLGRGIGRGDLEELCDVHRAYLEAIKFQCMLTPKLSVALDAIKRVLGLCLDLRLLYRTVLVDYMEGQASDYIFSPPPPSASSDPLAGTGQHSAASWSSWTGRLNHTRRGSIDMDDNDAWDAPAAASADVRSPGSGGGAAPHRRVISLPGVSSFAQLQTRLYSTCMSQLALLRTELRSSVRFLVTLLTKILEQGADNTHLQDVLCRLQFNDFYKAD